MKDVIMVPTGTSQRWHRQGSVGSLFVHVSLRLSKHSIVINYVKNPFFANSSNYYIKVILLMLDTYDPIHQNHILHCALWLCLVVHVNYEILICLLVHSF